MSTEYDIQVQEVLKQVPDADPDKIVDAFIRYEKDFLIPPADAIRAVLRRFQGDSAPSSGGSTSQSSSSVQRQSIPVKKVERLSELSADDKNVEIEVEIITHNARTTMVRGDEKTVPYGLLEDMPWAEGGESDRWQFKDWGNSPNLTPGAIVRLEGVSVNEYQGKMSLNINQSSAVIILREGTRSVSTPGEPVDIGSIKNEGTVTIVGRLLTSREDKIHRKDGTGSIDVVRGRLADDTGAIGFLSWEPFNHEIGSLLKIENSQVRCFRDTPELNFGSGTKIEVFHDSNFASADDLVATSMCKVEDLRDGARDVDIVIEFQKMIKRTFTGKDGEEKSVWSGDVADPTGRCRSSIWSEPPFDINALPVTVRVRSARVRAWQGVPDITIDDASQIEVMAGSPWGDEIDLANNIVEVDLSDLVSGPSRVGIQTSGTIVSVREDSGIIKRCPECRRVLRDGACFNHGEQDGNTDVRMRFVLDDGRSTVSLFVNKASTEQLLGLNEQQIESTISEKGQVEFVQSIREQFLGRQCSAVGRSLVDDNGAMLLADDVSMIESDSALVATELRAKWGVE
jgi:ssDNA-binding replication factor A large subunit